MDSETSDHNEVIGSNEISEILSRQVIPMMDIKNIYKYLEGLVKIPENDSDKFWDLRKTIIE